MNENGHVYVITNETGRVKIGRAKNPTQRLRTLETQSGLKITKSFISPLIGNYEKAEVDLHAKYKNKRVIGEWFDVNFNEVVSDLSIMKFDSPKEVSVSDEKASSAVKQMCACIVLNDLNNFCGEDWTAELNLAKWKPIKSDVDFIVCDLEEAKNCYVDDCDEYKLGEEVDAVINSIKKSGMTLDNITGVQNIYKDIFYSYPVGEIRKYVSGEYADLVEKILGITYINENERLVNEKYRQ
ncbi:GIY-YIG nuclease family protein [Desulfosporosinus youngiae]|uniref:T5orf172 domain-containing protein n=1 Tax=Desulfosporosinus youngiae DSM 17734 TaxID=768710 RepID=H5XZU2_9FIRM|nr:GIY-YIG nuclease family protein [Desulfosporosinus youngiae]EHQ92138.1 T5orf172 domain-containing protein [Desulfosporosinus youngiae DSM 17734]